MRDALALNLNFELPSMPLEWYAVHLRHQHENKIENILKSKGLTYFLPKREIVRNWTDRKKIISEPLFKGYVFVSAREADFPSLIETRGVIRILGAGSCKPTPIPYSDIEALQRFAMENIRLDPFPYLKTGTKVKIKQGPLKDIEGFVVRKRKECRIVLTIELMRQSVSLEVDEALLEVRN